MPYRSATTPEIEGGKSGWRGLVCSVLGHSRFVLFHMRARPWLCTRCGAWCRDGLSRDEFRETGDRATRWFAARAGDL